MTVGYDLVNIDPHKMNLIERVLMLIQIKVLAIISLLFSSQMMADGHITKELKITDDSFSCIRDMTKVGSLYVSNLNGDSAATIAVANSEVGGVYPEGSLVQLVPTEAMVKRKSGFNPATEDWEFFELKVSKTGSNINKRGFADVVNRFGGNCFACHIKAEKKWDMICKQGHGCDALPTTPAMISLIQKTDPRCESNEALTAEEIEAGIQLKKLLGG